MNPLSRQGYRVAGHIFFGLLFILACVLFKERILYADSAWYTFRIINDQGFDIESGRYSAFLTQIIPLLAVRMELPLGFVILGFSISFVIIYYGVYLISVYLLRNSVAGVAIMLVLVLGIRHSFFHSVTETHQAVVYIILLFAWLYYSPGIRQKGLRIFIHLAIAVLIMLLCYFAHPVSLFPVLFIIGFRILDKKDWRNYSLYALAIITLLLFTLKFLTTEEQSYEGLIFSSFSGSMDSARDFFGLYSFRYFLKRIGGQYLFIVIMALATGIYYLYRKAWLKLAYFILAGGGFFVITVLTYAMGDSDMAMERAFMPLGIFIIIPFVNDFIRGYGKPDLPSYAFVVIALLVSLGGDHQNRRYLPGEAGVYR